MCLSGARNYMTLRTLQLLLRRACPASPRQRAIMQPAGSHRPHATPPLTTSGTTREGGGGSAWGGEVGGVLSGKVCNGCAPRAPPWLPSLAWVKFSDPLLGAYSMCSKASSGERTMQYEGEPFKEPPKSDGVLSLKSGSQETCHVHLTIFSKWRCTRCAPLSVATRGTCRPGIARPAKRGC